jgi:hypothetical protein|tara:strand:+ start:125 stop:505 length:381 start_codon:yes stop_codon:yes gene_type:complete
MSKINLITPPDKLKNDLPSVLIVNPDQGIKQQFNDVAKQIKTDFNLYMFEEEVGVDTDWLLDVANYVDYILINIDECKATQWTVGHLLRFPNSWYMTKNDHVPYKKININRIFDLESFVKGVNYFE